MAVQAQSQPRAKLSAMPQVDFTLLLVVVALLLIGMMMIWSVTFMPRVGSEDAQGDFMRQALYAGIGLCSLLIMMLVNYRVWGFLALPMMVLTVAVLVALLIFGSDLNNSRRWVFGGSVQPSELAKFTVIVYMAKWLSSKGTKLRNVTYGLLPFAIIVGIVTGLILLQPNLSTAIIIALCAFGMFFIAGADLVQFTLTMMIGGGTIALVISRTGYLLSRWNVFIAQDVFSLATKESYQITQTLIALGSGGLLGRGIGEGLQKFGYLPAANNDSIFAILGEELGLIGTLTVLALFLAIAYRGFNIAAKTRDPFGQVLAAGLTFWILFQAFVNIAVVTSSIPYTGVPLPFISYGGSSLVTVLAAIGVLLNISSHGNLPSKEHRAFFNFRWGNRGTRVSRTVTRRRAPARSRRNT
jgi:cell division protein FtsW